MIDEALLYRILVRIAHKRKIDVVNDAAVRRGMAIVVLKNRGLTSFGGRRKI